ncbi:DUF1015 domain-containing protein [Candidatus Dependentiae bacterium]|nr:DUF1015 domain-containing protein [Candidatus Dependentiae bacterium]
MSTIKAFRGLRPNPEIASRLAVLPYDVLNSDEARKLAEGNKYSFFHVTKPEIDLDPKIDLYSDKVYETAKSNFKKFIDEGYLLIENKPCLYIYKQQMGNHIQIGLLACASVDEYEKNLIKKHELTRKDKEDDRARHVYETNCNAGPVFLTYRSRKKIDDLVNSCLDTIPVYDFSTADSGLEVRHTLYLITDDKLIKKLCSAFKKVPALYVADGHHRAASGYRVRALKKSENNNHNGKEEYNYFLTVLFPDNQLKIMPYNRVVKDLNGLTEQVLFEKIKEKFEITPVDEKCFSPAETKNIGMYINGKWYKLQPKKEIYDNDSPVDSLDVSILQKNILNPLLGIKDPRSDNRINFVGGIRGSAELEKLVDSGKYAVAFSMYPTSLDELMDIADAGQIMPPKSTWFEPKLRSGMVVHLLDDVETLKK